MSQEILQKLDEVKAELMAEMKARHSELKADLNSLRVDLLGAVSHGNETIDASIKGLRVSLSDTRDRLRAIGG